MKSSFTPAEATRTLPLVKRIVADVLAAGQAVRRLVNSRDETDTRRRLLELERELAALMRELEGIGCLYKDWSFDVGLVDFPSTIDGHDVYLCWKSDEEALEWYHPVEEGFAGRQKIPAEMLSES